MRGWSFIFLLFTIVALNRAKALSHPLNLPDLLVVSLHSDSTNQIHIPQGLTLAEKSDYVARSFNLLQFGQMQYVYDSEMTIGQNYPFKVFISQNVATELIKELKGFNIAEIDTIRVSPTMSVHLYSTTFDVIPSDPIEQAVDSEFTKWLFDVKPKERGEQFLNLVVYAKIELPNKSVRSKSVESVRKLVMVHVTFFQQVSGILSSAWGAVVGPVLAGVLVYYITRKWKRRRRSRRR